MAIVDEIPILEFRRPELERLTVERNDLQAEVRRLNEMLRQTGYGQGQIDAYAAQCERIAELEAENERLRTFKELVHSTLDQWGVPDHADKECRITHRLEDLDKLIDEHLAAERHARNHEGARLQAYIERISAHARSQADELMRAQARLAAVQKHIVDTYQWLDPHPPAEAKPVEALHCVEDALQVLRAQPPEEPSDA